MLIGIMLNVVILSVVILSVVAPACLLRSTLNKNTSGTYSINLLLAVIYIWACECGCVSVGV